MSDRIIKGRLGDTWIACDAPAVIALYGAELLDTPVPLCDAHMKRIKKPTWREDNLWRRAMPGEVCCQPRLTE